MSTRKLTIIDNGDSVTTSGDISGSILEILPFFHCAVASVIDALHGSLVEHGIDNGRELATVLFVVKQALDGFAEEFTEEAVQKAYQQISEFEGTEATVKKAR